MASSPQAKVVIYSKPSCAYCMGAKALLSRKNIPFQEINIQEDHDALEDMLKKSNGRRTVPQIFIGQTHVGGFDDLVALEKSRALYDLISAD